MKSFFKDKWVQIGTIATTVLAVCAAISALKGGGFSTKAQITTTQASNQWSYYQSKSIKQTIIKSEFDIMTALGKKDSDQKIKFYNDEIARYEKEKTEIKQQAEQLDKKIETYRRYSGNFGLAVMLLQIAIMLNSVGILLKRQPLWYIGLGFGVLGIIYMFLGFLL